MKIISSVVILCSLVASVAYAAEPAPTTFKLDFGPGKVSSGYTQVLPKHLYSKETGWGFDLGSQAVAVDRGGKDDLRGDFCTGDKPLYFSVALPEGNYSVTVTFGDADGATTNTVKAELRRLMLEDVRTAAGKFETRAFTVNVRSAKISTGGEVRLKPRELAEEFIAWDEKLTLEFNGARPCVCALEISPAPAVPTVFILGDSTVCDQPREPWNSWGQMLPRFFKPGVAVANHAESGEAIGSSLGAHRFDKVYSQMKKGDYLFIQYGHNDMKDKKPDALDTYKSNLKKIITKTREFGGTPVLVTSMERKNGVTSDTLLGYPNAVIEVAKAENTALIDLHATSKIFYAALGEDIGKAFQDGTHHNNYGSYELAKCIIDGIKANKLDLAKFIVDDVKPFDPSHPDPVGSFNMPASPASSTLKPDGN